MSVSAGSAQPRRGLISDLLTFDRLLTGPVVHLIYWCGLCLILLFGFGAVGASVGLALRALSFEGVLIALPALVAGLLIMAALALIWRGVCEFYLAVFRIAEDLHILRVEHEAELRASPPRATSPRRAPRDDATAL